MRAKYVPKVANGDVNISRDSLVKDMLVMLAGATAVVIVAYFILGMSVGYLAQYVPYSWERQLASYTGNLPMLKQSEEAPTHLTILADRVRKANTDVPFPAEVYILPTEMPNAFALPGARIVITTGLLNSLGSENELVFVLGHEYGHIANRDHLKQTGRALIGMLFAAFLFDSPAPTDLLEETLGLTELKFSREQENAADESGQDALVAVYGHVGGMTDFFERIAGDGPSYFAKFKLTHPETQSRIKHLEDRATKNGWGVAPLMPLGDVYTPAPQT